MNKGDYISLEVAKLLKEKGYDEPCLTAYDKAGNIGSQYTVINWNKEYDWAISRPTLYEAQKWLREKYNCYVQVTHEAYKTGVNNLVQVLFYEPNDDDCWSNESTGMYGDNAEFKTYEEALNFGILEALKRI